MTTETTRRLVGSWLEALNHRDEDAYVALLADDVEQVSPSERLSGLAELRRDVRDLFESQPDLVTTVRCLVVEGDRAAVEYHMTATLTGDIHFGDGRVVAATRRRYDMDGCSFLRVNDGRIAEVHHYWDRALMAAQLGLGAPPATASPSS